MQPAANRSQSLFLALIAGLVALSLAACSSATSSPSADDGGSETASSGDGKHDSFMAQNKSDGLYDVEPGSAEAGGILELVNTASFEVLDDDVSLDVRAAENIVEARQKSEIATLEELDAIAWVGPRAFGKLYEYARANGYFDGDSQAETIHGVAVESPKARAILEVANRASHRKLDERVELDSRAADAIVEYRTEGADDLSIDSLTELAGISWVAEEAFGNLGAYVEANDLVPAEVAGIIEGTYEALAVVELANESSREKLDVEVGLDARAADNIVTYRNDEGSVESLTELDGIHWVGTSAIESLLAHAESTGSVPACGDGTTDAIEACDDGNLENGDGCTASCRLETLREPPESNQNRRSTYALGDYRLVHGTTFHDDGRTNTDLWKFELSERTRVYVDVFSRGVKMDGCYGFRDSSGTYNFFKPEVSIQDASENRTAREPFYAQSDCGKPRSEKGGDWNVVRTLSAGTYYVRIKGQITFSDYETPYGMEVKMEPVETDGCNASCNLDVKRETVSRFSDAEPPNRTPSDAIDLGDHLRAKGVTSYDDDRDTVGKIDVDYWKFEVAKKSTVSIDFYKDVDIFKDRYSIRAHRAMDDMMYDLMFRPNVRIENADGETVTEVHGRLAERRTSAHSDWDETVKLSAGTYYVRIRAQIPTPDIPGDLTHYTTDYRFDLNMQ